MHVPAEPDLEPWREALTQPTDSYSSSSNSGDWVWDQASDQSSPSTPSPPLPPEAAHFLFGEPTQRKRKVSWGSPGRVDSSAAPDTHPVAQSAVQVVFQCLWKSCGKVLRTASAIQRHIRLVHLGCGGAGGRAVGPGQASASAPLLCPQQETGRA